MRHRFMSQRSRSLLALLAGLAVSTHATSSQGEEAPAPSSVSASSAGVPNYESTLTEAKRDFASGHTDEALTKIKRLLQPRAKWWHERQDRFWLELEIYRERCLRNSFEAEKSRYLSKYSPFIENIEKASQTSNDDFFIWAANTHPKIGAAFSKYNSVVNAPTAAAVLTTAGPNDRAHLRHQIESVLLDNQKAIEDVIWKWHKEISRLRAVETSVKQSNLPTDLARTPAADDSVSPEVIIWPSVGEEWPGESQWAIASAPSRCASANSAPAVLPELKFQIKDESAFESIEGNIQEKAKAMDQLSESEDEQVIPKPEWIRKMARFWAEIRFAKFETEDEKEMLLNRWESRLRSATVASHRAALAKRIEISEAAIGYETYLAWIRPSKFEVAMKKNYAKLLHLTPESDRAAKLFEDVHSYRKDKESLKAAIENARHAKLLAPPGSLRERQASRIAERARAKYLESFATDEFAKKLKSQTAQKDLVQPVDKKMKDPK